MRAPSRGYVTSLPARTGGDDDTMPIGPDDADVYNVHDE